MTEPKYDDELIRELEREQMERMYEAEHTRRLEAVAEAAAALVGSSKQPSEAINLWAELVGALRAAGYLKVTGE